MSGPLDAVRVLDLTSLLPGAVATGLLADLGADVIKLERPPGGDGLRASPPFGVDGVSSGHRWLNRGKRSIVVNLKEAQGRAAFLDVLADADVFLDSLRPGALDRLDLGDEVIRRANPQLIHVSITFRRRGTPHAEEAGHDLNAQAESGILCLGTAPGAPPQTPYIQAADHLVGHQAAVAVLALLYQRASTGSGGRCDVSMIDAAYSLLGLAGAAAAVTGESVEPGPLTGALACYQTYACRDGRFVAVGALEPTLFSRLIAALGLSRALAERQYDPNAQAELARQLAATFAGKPRDTWLTLLADVDCCVTPVLGVAEALLVPGAPTVGVFGSGLALAPIPRLPGIDPEEVASRPAPALGADHPPVHGDAGTVWSAR